MGNRKYGTSISLEKAEEGYKAYKYALVYRSGEIQLSDIAQANCKGLFEEEEYRADGCLEARFFSGDGELHLFSSEGQVRAVATDYRGLDREKYLDEKYTLAKSFQFVSGTLTKTTLVVRRLLDTDEDGQTVIRQTGLAGLEA